MAMDDAVVAEKVACWMAQLHHPEAAQRLQAAANLSRLAERARAAVPGLVARLRDENAHVRKMAALGLGEIGTPIEIDRAGPGRSPDRL